VQAPERGDACAGVRISAHEAGQGGDQFRVVVAGYREAADVGILVLPLGLEQQAG
jgi:hypothetical protein